MKFIKILVVTALISISSLANATLLTELTEDNYITVYHSDIGINLDWTWASNYNVETYYSFGTNVYNTLYEPERYGWRSATEQEFSFFANNLTAEAFEYSGLGGYKNSVSFFNSSPELGFSVSDFDKKNISGSFVSGSNMSFINKSSFGLYETFYVRNQPGASIPEPGILLILVIGLFALSLKRMKTKLS